MAHSSWCWSHHPVVWPCCLQGHIWTWGRSTPAFRWQGQLTGGEITWQMTSTLLLWHQVWRNSPGFCMDSVEGKQREKLCLPLEKNHLVAIVSRFLLAYSYSLCVLGISCPYWCVLSPSLLQDVCKTHSSFLKAQGMIPKRLQTSLEANPMLKDYCKVKHSRIRKWHNLNCPPILIQPLLPRCPLKWAHKLWHPCWMTLT